MFKNGKLIQYLLLLILQTMLAFNRGAKRAGVALGLVDTGHSVLSLTAGDAVILTVASPNGHSATAIMGRDEKPKQVFGDKRALDGFE